MTNAVPEYCRYFLFSPEMRCWGLGITAAGKAAVTPGAPYPVGPHPLDHQMNWEHGRVLDALQVVLITGGAGWLETGAEGLRRVEDGMVFLLLPKVWHRYRPDPACGWKESWFEVRGPVVDSLLAGGLFSEKSILLPGAVAAGMEEQLESIHRLLQSPPPGGPGLVSSEALRVLAHCASLPALDSCRRHIELAVRQAARILDERHAEAVNIEDLARELGVAYSHFRRSFKRITGHSPWQYVLQARISRARRLLASSDATLEDIATRLGFSSGFHFSHAFKQACGVSPSRWRSRMQRTSTTAGGP